MLVCSLDFFNHSNEYNYIAHFHSNYMHFQYDIRYPIKTQFVFFKACILVTLKKSNLVKKAWALLPHLLWENIEAMTHTPPC